MTRKPKKHSRLHQLVKELLRQVDNLETQMPELFVDEGREGLRPKSSRRNFGDMLEDSVGSPVTDDKLEEVFIQPASPPRSQPSLPDSPVHLLPVTYDEMQITPNQEAMPGYFFCN